MASKETCDHLALCDMESKETWEQDWLEGDPQFHTNEVNPMLIRHYDEFTAGKNNLRVLVPLCGKSLDMVWLADKGHSVVGVELIGKAIEDFFRDNKLLFTKETVSLSPSDQAAVFKAMEKDITLFECSIFDFSSEVSDAGQFDCVWDRGSMTAIKMMKEGRMKQYADIMLLCLKPHGRYLLEFFATESPEETSSSSFQFISEDDLIDLFSERCTIQFLGKTKLESDEKKQATDEHSKSSTEETGEELNLYMNYYLMKLK